MTDTVPPSVAILGGGATGVLLALHLLRDPAADVRVTLIDASPAPGRGLAYSTPDLCHVLNVIPGNMSPFPDDPDHFWRWLEARGLVTGPDRFVFVPRRWYGDYLEELLESIRDDRLTIVTATATGIGPESDGVEITLGTGAHLRANHAILALGHDHRTARFGGLAVRPGSRDDTPLDPDAPVLILGSGLSMIDAWLSLEAAGHRGPITVISRHGLLPHRHRSVEKRALETVPLGSSALALSRWLRATVRRTGGDWRSIIDALRPHTQRIWQGWSERSRRSFLAHLRPYWAIHRHRLPEPIADRFEAAVAAGRIRVEAARLLGIEAQENGVLAHLRRRGGGTEIRAVARVYDCGGLAVDVAESANPALRDLVARGLARPDPLHIGLDVTASLAVIAGDGTAATRLFALGPLTRGRFFEIEAIPDIRVQAAALSQRILNGQSARTSAHALG
jgi:uncharacterized NAD(P)/FAD-binding protein YdhS